MQIKTCIQASGADNACGLNFGQEIPFDTVQPGDIVQFKTCVFKMPDGSVKTAGMPDHTAVVTAAFGRDGEIQVIEQNPKPVGLGSYNPRYLTNGTFKAWRVVPKRED